TDEHALLLHRAFLLALYTPIWRKLSSTLEYLSSAAADDHLVPHARAPRAPALVDVRARAADAAEHPLLLAPRREPHLRGAEEAGRLRPGDRRPRVRRPAAATRLCHLGPWARGAPRVARRAGTRAGCRVRGVGQGPLRRAIGERGAPRDARVDPGGRRGDAQA